MISPLCKICPMGFIMSFTVALLNLSHTSLCTRNAKSSTVLPFGSSITSPFGVYTNILLSSISMESLSLKLSSFSNV